MADIWEEAVSSLLAKLPDLVAQEALTAGESRVIQHLASCWRAGQAPIVLWCSLGSKCVNGAPGIHQLAPSCRAAG